MHCRECGYALWNLSEPTCPECGTGFDLHDYRFEPGTAEFLCPLCGHAHAGRTPYGLPGLVWRNCEGCGERIDVDQMAVRPAGDEPVPAELISRTAMTWTNRDRLGVVRAWWQTIRLIVTRPADVGRRLAYFDLFDDGAWFVSFSYMILFCVLGVILGLSSIYAGELEPVYFYGALYVPCGIVFSIVVPPAVMMIAAFAAHPFLVTFTDPRHGFNRTVSSLCLGQWPAGLLVLAIVPHAGPVLAAVVCFAMTVFAARVLAAVQQVNVVVAWAACVSLPIAVVLFVGFMTLF